MGHILALDQGTTSSRAIVFDGSARAIASAQEEFEQIFPRAGWVEHDPEAIWRTQIDTARKAVGQARIDPSDLVAIGITNQRETTVVWDRATGKPIANAIVWQDRRTAGMCDELRARGAEETIRARTGLVVDAYFSGTKIAWLLDHVEGARARAERGDLCAGTIDCWLIWKLTGGRCHATDATNASRTMLMDLRSTEWSDELCELLRVPRAMLPDIRDSSGAIATADPELGLGAAPIAGVVGDQQAALAGQACFSPGLAKNTYGTGCFLLSNTGAKAQISENNLLTTVAWRRDGATTYALEGSVFIAGAAVQWLRDGLGIIKHASEIEHLAREADTSDDVFFVPALAGLGAPHWDPRARGTIVGLTRGSTRAHLARAALEGIAFQVAELAEAMNRDAGTPIDLLRVDGGASANDLLMQRQADMLQIPIERPKDVESTALGAAYMAGLASGVWKDADEIGAMREVDRVFEPAISSDEAQSNIARWRQAVERARGWADS